MVAAAAEFRLSLRLPDEAATARLAEDIAAILKAGDLLALSGGLGAGKTAFARALLRALAGEPMLDVPSPTFPLRIDHLLPRLKVAHVDLYRLAGGADLSELGLEEAIGEAALVVEWPDRLPDLAEDRLDLTFEIEESGRRVVISGRGSWPARLARSARIRAFLDHVAPGASRAPLIGDASTRAYERIALPEPVPPRGNGSRGVAGRTAILMNAPLRPEGPPLYDGRSYDAVAHRARDIRAFVAIGAALREAGIHAPEILAADLDSGLLLLEDLGSEPIVDASGSPILSRYEVAIDCLLRLHAHRWAGALPVPESGAYSVPPYDREALLVEISLFPDYFGGAGGEAAFPSAQRAPFLAAWSAILATLEVSATTLVLRDFHSPNILWRADAQGVARVGVIDFQDALIGHPAYDVASLAQDARVPLSESDEAALKARYVSGRKAADPGFDTAAFDAAYAILGLQRATKVLGIFTRLALTEGKPGYRRHRARLKALLRRNLAHPVLSPLRVWYEPHL